MACMDIVTTTGDDARNHAKQDGWYSHGVLAKVLDQFMPPIGRLLDRLLPSGSYHAFATDPKCLGGIVNHGNPHWTAIVKNVGCEWHVNSQMWPVLLNAETYQQLLLSNPLTFVLVANDFTE